MELLNKIIKEESIDIVIESEPPWFLDQKNDVVIKVSNRNVKMQIQQQRIARYHGKTYGTSTLHQT